MIKRMLSVACGLVLSMSLLNVSAIVTPAQTERRPNVGSRQTARPQQLPPAEAIITLNEQFLNSLLDAVFTNLRRPSFPLSMGEARPNENSPAPKAANALAPSKFNQCASQIVLEREMGGVRTAVRFENGRITAPLAFTGTYNTGLLGCFNFQGWADTVINLEFNRQRQTLNAHVDVVDIHLSGIPQLANGIVVQMVQNAIDQRINPVEILQATQLTTRLPISAAGGALRLSARELRAEVVPGAVRIHIIYDFVRAD